MSDPLVYVRAVHFAATIVAAGTVIFQCLIAAPALATASRDLSPARERLRSRWAWMVWASLAVAVLSGAIWLVLLAADIYDAPVDEVWRNGDIWTVAMQTRFGQVSMARLALAVLLAGWLAMLAYGRLVLAKIALFAAMVSIAAVNRFHLTPRLAAAGAVRRLQHNSLAETALGIAAILVVGFLGTMAPASHAHLHPAYAAVPAGAAFVHIHSVAGMADVTIMPGRVGGEHATIRLWNEDFEPLAAEKVTLALTAPAAGSKPVIRAASQDEDGNWQIDGIELSQPGNWIVAVDAGLDAKRRLLLEAPIVIEPEQ